MKVGDILKKRFTVSFEFFPPKTEEGEKELFDNLHKLEMIDPDFVSVTYGAGGSTRDKTRQIVERIAAEEKLTVMAHLTCVGHTRSEMMEILTSYKNAGVENILALRGDTPTGTNIHPQDGEMPHAVDLIRMISNNFDGHFSIGGAVFPEKHLESKDWDSDMRYFREKVDAGLDFAISQLFFENRYYFELLEKCEKTGVSIPLIPGIMPITNFKQVEKFVSLCGAKIPMKLVEELSKYQDRNEEIAKIGVEYAIHQCEDLLKSGVPGLHFYTLNKSNATLEIFSAIQSKIDSDIR